MIELIWLSLLLTLSAFFSGSETALFSLNDVDLHELEGRSGAAQRVLALVRRPRRTLVTILLANMVVNVLISVLTTMLCLQWFGPRGLAVAIPAATIILLLFGEIVPKSLGLRRGLSVALLASGPLTALAWALGPVRTALEKLADATTGRHVAPPLTKEELPTLVDVAQEGGEISRFESRVLRRVLRFADTPLSRCLTPRVEMVTVAAEDSVASTLRAFEDSGRSRLPVTGDGPDDVIGVLLLKDVLTQPGTLDGILVRELAREVLHEPETVSAISLFRRFQTERVHLAVIVDEHGGVEGLVTLEDLLEELVGDIRDESDEIPAQLEELDEGVYRGAASLELVEVAEALGIDFAPDDEDVVTLAGVLQKQLGRVPARGDVVSWHGCKIRVLTASANRARLVRIEARKTS